MRGRLRVTSFADDPLNGSSNMTSYKGFEIPKYGGKFHLCSSILYVF